jgi:hypothetical protein
MYARIATLKVKPGMEDDFLRTLSYQGAPTFLSLEGVEMSAYVDRDRHEAIVITLWRTRGEAEGASSERQWQDFVARAQEALEAPSTVQNFELALTERACHDPPGIGTGYNSSRETRMADDKAAMAMIEDALAHLRVWLARADPVTLRHFRYASLGLDTIRSIDLRVGNKSGRPYSMFSSSEASPGEPRERRA